LDSSIQLVARKAKVATLRPGKARLRPWETLIATRCVFGDEAIRIAGTRLFCDRL
jgi:hypothetical protein